MTTLGHTDYRRLVPYNLAPTVRLDASYRGARRTQARKRKLVWRTLPHLAGAHGQCVVEIPPW